MIERISAADDSLLADRLIAFTMVEAPEKTELTSFLMKDNVLGFRNQYITIGNGKGSRHLKMRAFSLGTFLRGESLPLQVPFV